MVFRKPVPVVFDEPPKFFWDYFTRPKITVEKMHNCETCGHGSDTVSEMVAHECEVHLWHRGMYGCGTCKLYYAAKVDLIRHKMTECSKTPEHQRIVNRKKLEEQDAKEIEDIIEGIKSGAILRHPYFIEKEEAEMVNIDEKPDDQFEDRIEVVARAPSPVAIPPEPESEAPGILCLSNW